MLLKQVMDLFELLDTPRACGETIKEVMLANGADEVSVQTVTGEKGSTDSIKILIKGRNGKSSGGTAPTLGIIGRLGPVPAGNRGSPGRAGRPAGGHRLRLRR